MKADPPEVVAARIEAGRARARLMDSAQKLQVRLSPATLARDAWEGAKGKGADLAEGAVDAVRARPLAATGVVAALALFLAREPLLDLAGKVTRKGEASPRKKRSKRKTGETEKAE